VNGKRGRAGDGGRSELLVEVVLEGLARDLVAGRLHQAGHVVGGQRISEGARLARAFTHTGELLELAICSSTPSSVTASRNAVVSVGGAAPAPTGKNAHTAVATATTKDKRLPIKHSPPANGARSSGAT
jgi:hypothetical protein